MDSAKVCVCVVEPSDINDRELSQLSTLVNEAYFVGERGICHPSMQRTSTKDLQQLIHHGELIGLRIDKSWTGCIHVRASNYDKTGQSAIFGMLVVADNPSFRGKGFGTLLVRAAEAWARRKNFTHMNLELLKPKQFSHAHKDRLESWYTQIGYLPILSLPFPHTELLTINEYDFKIYSKKL